MQTLILKVTSNTILIKIYAIFLSSVLTVPFSVYIIMYITKQ